MTTGLVEQNHKMTSVHRTVAKLESERDMAQLDLEVARMKKSIIFELTEAARQTWETIESLELDVGLLDRIRVKELLLAALASQMTEQMTEQMPLRPNK